VDLRRRKEPLGNGGVGILVDFIGLMGLKSLKGGILSNENEDTWIFGILEQLIAGDSFFLSAVLNENLDNRLEVFNVSGINSNDGDDCDHKICQIIIDLNRISTAICYMASKILNIFLKRFFTYI
jgi:hypothetical protein